MEQKKTRISFLIFFLFLTVMLIIIAWPFAKAAFLAFTLAVIFAPMYKLINRKIRINRYVNATVSAIIICLCVILPIAVIISVAVVEAEGFLNVFESELKGGALSGNVNTILLAVKNWITSKIGYHVVEAEFTTMAMGVVKNITAKIYEYSPKVLMSTFSVIVNFALTFLFLIVVFAEGQNIYSEFQKLVPLSKNHIEMFSRALRITITTSLSSLLIIGLAQGVMLGLGYWVAGFDNPLGWGLISVIIAAVPIIGSSACYIVATITLFAIGRTNAAILFLIYGLLIISQIDTIIRTFVVKGCTKIHPILLFVMVLGGVSLMGPIGLIIGPVLLSVFLAAFKIYKEEFAG